MDDFKRLRPAGPLEKFFIACNETGINSIVAVSATYILPDTFTRPLRDYIYQACGSLIDQHPSLSAIPAQGADGTWWFVRLPEIDLSQPVSFQRRIHDFPEVEEPDVELCELLQIQQCTGFKASLPCWRLFILTDRDEANAQRFTAVYIYHHAIADGISGKAFHETFLEALHDADVSLTRGEPTKQVIQSPTTPLLPNLELLHPCPSSLTFLLYWLFKDKVWSYPEPNLWTGPELFIPKKLQIRQIILPAAVSAAFRRNCRENKTTINSASHAAVAHALFAHLPKNYTKLQIAGAMSCRRWLKEGGVVTDRSMGNWVMDFKERFSRHKMNRSDPDAFPWSEARKSRATVEQILSRGGRDTSVSLLKHEANIQGYLQGRIGKSRFSSVEVSNIGILKSDKEDSSWPQVTRVMFSQPLDAANAPIGVSLISGGDGCLIVGFTWQEGVADTEFFEAVIDTLTKNLYNAAK
ncbi:hypothetical protein AbraIFM66950_005197 [Aspergillus brasiliensis]|nr:hypothetical protein AbraIFM66950_005197 [Aspergillus brasiliensis]